MRSTAKKCLRTVLFGAEAISRLAARFLIYLLVLGVVLVHAPSPRGRRKAI